MNILSPNKHVFNNKTEPPAERMIRLRMQLVLRKKMMVANILYYMIVHAQKTGKSSEVVKVSIKIMQDTY